MALHQVRGGVLAPDPVINVYPPAGTPSWVNGLFILAGAIAGAGLTLLSTMLSDRRRTRSEIVREEVKVRTEDERRWHEKTRELAAAFLTAVRTDQASYENFRRWTRRLVGPDYVPGQHGQFVDTIDTNMMIRRLLVRPKLVYDLMAVKRDRAKDVRETMRSYLELRLIAPSGVVQLADKVYRHQTSTPRTLQITDEQFKLRKAINAELEMALVDAVREHIVWSPTVPTDDRASPS